MIVPSTPPAILPTVHRAVFLSPAAAVAGSTRKHLVSVNLGGIRPTVTIRKVVRGAEPAPGFAYPMRVECWSPADAFVSTSGARVSFGGETFQVPLPEGIGAGIRLVIPGAVHEIDGYANDADLSGLTFDEAKALLVAIRAFNASAVNLRPLQPSPALLPLGRLMLTNGAVRTFGPAEFPGLGLRTFCDVTELDTQGSVVSYASTNRMDPVRPGVQVNDVFKSAPTAAGVTESITVTNSFVGELIVSKAVTGDPRTNIAIYEVAVDCGPNRPMERFVLRDRQSRVLTDIPAGTACVVTELKSDGAQAIFTDNSDHPNDGRIVIQRYTHTCDRGVVGEENSCAASVLITNAYGPVASELARRTTPTTLGPTTSSRPSTSTTSTTSTTTIPGGSTTTSTVLIVFGVTTTTLRNVDRLFAGPLPPVDETPAHAIDAEPTFTG